MNGWSDGIHAFAAFWANAMWRAGWQGGLGIVVVWFICRAWPRSPPRVQCWLWRFAYLRFFVALFLATPLDLPPSLHELWYAISILPGRAGLSVAVGLSLLWLFGVGWCLRRVCHEWCVALALRRDCRPLDNAQLHRCCAELCERLGIKLTPTLVVCENGTLPFLTGLRRPIICLPSSMVRDYSGEHVRLVLVSELANLQRGTLLWAWLPTAANTFFFFHPLVWLANRQFRAAQEAVCDELALKMGGASIGEYARLLMKVAEKRMDVPLARNGNGAADVASLLGPLKGRLTRLHQRRPPQPSRNKIVVREDATGSDCE